MSRTSCNELSSHQHAFVWKWQRATFPGTNAYSLIHQLIEIDVDMTAVGIEICQLIVHRVIARQILGLVGFQGFAGIAERLDQLHLEGANLGSVAAVSEQQIGLIFVEHGVFDVLGATPTNLFHCSCLKPEQSKLFKVWFIAFDQLIGVLVFHSQAVSNQAAINARFRFNLNMD